MTHFDIAVIGGGTAGITAAIQAGRAGAKTLLVEKTGMLGGTITNAMIAYPSSFHAYGKQVIAGIGWELVCKTYEETGHPLPDFSTDYGRAGQATAVLNRAIFATLVDEAVLDAGVEMLLHTMPAQVNFDNDRWTITLCTKTGLHDITATVLIDCTGDANAVTLAGFPTENGDELQPGTLFFTVSGYDKESLDYAALQAAFETEVAAGRMLTSDPGYGGGRIAFFIGSYGGNRAQVTGINGHTSEGKTRAEIEGRQVMMRLYRFCRQQPGMAGITIEHVAPECGIRETVTIVGNKRITVEDYEGGRLWEDAVCYSFYPIDIHRATDTVYRAIAPGIYPTIPLGAMLPAGSRRLIVAGRCIAGDRESNSSYRVEAPCMAMGQAAGAAAILAVRQGCDLSEVPMRDLHSLLKEHGAIVPTPDGL